MLNNSEEEYQKFIETQVMAQRKSLRFNLSKIQSIEKSVLELKKRGVELEQIPFCENGFFIKDLGKENNKTLGNTLEHFLGKIYMQEATSMTPVLALQMPEKIDKDFMVLDMCASPGSKTTQVADLMKNKGIIIANELDYKRISPLKTNLERCGFTNVLISNLDAVKIEGSEIFDRILLDAPCSGSGVIRKSPKTIVTYNPKKLKSISNLQLKLLFRAFELLKKGGVLIYSTCSLDPEENEILIKRFLEEKKEAIIDKIEMNINQEDNLKIREFENQKIPNEITEKTIRIWPHLNNSNGFFLCRILKN